MAKWISLQNEKLIHQPDQQAFLAARRLRRCRPCYTIYRQSGLSKAEADAKSQYICPPILECPTCKVKGSRLFDRLTIIAGRRWGKSRIGAIAGAEEASIGNTIGWACAPTNPKLHRYVIPAFQQLIPQEWVREWKQEHGDLWLKNGSLIHFQTLEDPDQGRGQGLDWLWVDEVCELTIKHWEVIRPSLAGDTVAFFTTSPRSYDWVYDELYRPAETGIGADGNPITGYWACHAKTSQSANPRITPEFLAREKSQMSETMYRQEYEADFVIFTGAIYGGSVDPQILRTDEQIKDLIPEWNGDLSSIAPWRQVLVGIDTGADHPFGAVKLISTEKGMVVVGEYLERHRSFLEHKASLIRLAGNSNARWGINRNERQPMIELAQPPYSIMCSPAENDVVAGTERVKSWLQVKQLWFIEQYCPLTIKQMKAYRWAENTSPKTGEARKEKVYKKEDELPDCIRYALMTWPLLPKEVVPEQKRDISNLPDHMQATIRILRKIDDPKDEPESITGDFWE